MTLVVAISSSQWLMYFCTVRWYYPPATNRWQSFTVNASFCSSLDMKLFTPADQTVTSEQAQSVCCDISTIKKTQKPKNIQKETKVLQAEKAEMYYNKYILCIEYQISYSL